MSAETDCSNLNDHSQYYTIPVYKHVFWALAFGRGYIGFAADVHNHPKNRSKDRFVDRDTMDSAWFQTLDELFEYWDGERYSKAEMQTKLDAAHAQVSSEYAERYWKRKADELGMPHLTEPSVWACVDLVTITKKAEELGVGSEETGQPFDQTLFDEQQALFAESKSRHEVQALEDNWTIFTIERTWVTIFTPSF